MLEPAPCHVHTIQGKILAKGDGQRIAGRGDLLGAVCGTFL